MLSVRKNPNTSCIPTSDVVNTKVHGVTNRRQPNIPRSHFRIGRQPILTKDIGRCVNRTALQMISTDRQRNTHFDDDEDDADESV